MLIHNGTKSSKAISGKLSIIKDTNVMLEFIWQIAVLPINPRLFLLTNNASHMFSPSGHFHSDQSFHQIQITTSTTIIVLRPFVWDYQGEWYQKDKPFWISLKQTRWVTVASAKPYASYMHFAPKDNHASTSSLRSVSYTHLTLPTNREV